jgi:hypothetical protein
MPTAVSMAPTMPAMTAITIVITLAVPIAITAAMSATLPVVTAVVTMTTAYAKQQDGSADENGGATAARDPKCSHRKPPEFTGSRTREESAI